MATEQQAEFAPNEPVDFVVVSSPKSKSKCPNMRPKRCERSRTERGAAAASDATPCMW